MQSGVLMGAALLFALAVSAWSGAAAAASQRVLSVTAYPTAIAAGDGVTNITVRIPTDAAGDETRVNLSTDRGAFTAASGPTEISAPLIEVGNDQLGASIKLVADGRAGDAIVIARVGSLVDNVTIRFVGETARLRLEQPADQARLDASEPHLLVITAADETGFGAPSTAVSFELRAAPEGALLRSGADASTSRLNVLTAQGGEARAWLLSAPGDVELEIESGSASLTLSFEFYGEPTSLRLVPVSGVAMEVGTVGAPGSFQALLLDERGQGVPNEPIRFQSEGGLQVMTDDDGETLVTDGSGRARAHLDAESARLGLRRVSATWKQGEQTLSDALEIRVTGPPVTMYLRARQSAIELEEVLIEEFAASTRYRLEAEVVDELGQPVAGAYRVRWRPLISGAAAQAYPEVSVTQNGVASAIFDLQHVDGVPRTEATLAQAWLIAKAQVNSNGIIADLLGEGTPLRANWNKLIWRGPETTVSEAVAPIAHVVSAAWKQAPDGSWQAWFTTDVPGAVDFTLEPGDHFLLVLRSGALLEHVERQ